MVFNRMNDGPYRRRQRRRSSRGILKWILTLGVLAASAPAAAALPDSVMRALDRHRLPADSLSVWVQDVTEEEPLLSHRPDTPRNPASTIKVLTTLAALEELGPTYTWKTDVYVTGPVVKGRLEGDLVLVGSGDPFLVVEQVWRMLAAVKARGLEEVAGRLVIDHSRFSVADEPAAGEFDRKPYRAYNALPDAFLVNFNALDLIVEPNGGGIRVRTDPPVEGLRLVKDRLRFMNGGCGRQRVWFEVSGGLGVGSPLDAPLPAIEFTGRFPKRCARVSFARTVLPPVRFADGVVRALWTGLGGHIEGGLALAPRPEGATRWYRHRSPPLPVVIRGINKFSNNVMARNLFLSLGAERIGVPGTTDKGRRAVAAWLERRKIEIPNLWVENGSGLARETRITARGLGGVLMAGDRSRFRPEFAQSLPLASLEGSMRRRLRNHSGASRARIKTGLLKNVRAMAGYVRTRRGGTLAVVALQEHPGVHQGGRGTAVHDALLAWLLDRD